MKKKIAVLMVAFVVWATLASAMSMQEIEELCPFVTTATGSALYEVMVGDSAVSQHTRVDKALERAVREETLDPMLEVRIVQDYELRVECPETWTRAAARDIEDMIMLEVPGPEAGAAVNVPEGQGTRLILAAIRNDSVVGCGGATMEYPCPIYMGPVLAGWR